MPPKKAAIKGLGRAIENQRRKRVEQPQAVAPRNTGVLEKQAARSVLEQNSLDEFITTAELARQTFEAQRGREHQIVEHEPRVVAQPQISSAARSEAERAAAASRVYVPIPRRPQWTEETTAEELSAAEGEAFVAWRKSLARLEEEKGLVMTPYERNLDFWRQLWRCVERSKLLVQILDARDPEFYLCHDLQRYVADVPGSKSTLLLVNKADFLSPELRRQWTAHFKERGINFIFFSALRELRRQSHSAASGGSAPSEATPQPRPSERELGEEVAGERGQATAGPEGPHLNDERDVVDCLGLLEELRKRLGLGDRWADRSGEAPVVGFVGYPNVGKSSVINALFGAKKVSMSRTPGKTKHLQTLELQEWGITLCDCPGLVFPSVVATKAHLIINGVVPLVEVRDFVPAVCIVLQRVGILKVVEKFSCGSAVTPPALLKASEATAEVAHAVLAAIATSRQHFLAHGVPDESWAARRLLRDFVTGALPWCEHPPGVEASVAQAESDARPADKAVTGANLVVDDAPNNDDEDDDDFDDLGEFLEGHARPPRTKRAERHQNKRNARSAGTLTVSVP